MREHRILTDDGKCIGCGLCSRVCPAGNILIQDKKAVIKTQECIKCGHCAAVCPKAAITLTGFEEPPLEINKPVVLDPDLLLDAVRTRRSIRQFTRRPVTSDIIDQIIEAGRYTPTGSNAQDVSYIVLKDKLAVCEDKAVRFFRKLMPVAKLKIPAAKNVSVDEHFFFKNAPAAIVILSESKINGALAASNMELMAQAFGLGVLYSGFFTMAANVSPSLRKKLGLKRGEKAVTTLVLGYSAIHFRRTAQKESADVRFL